MNNSDLVLGHALKVGGCLFLVFGLTSWYMRIASASQGNTVRNPKWLDGIPIVCGLLMIAGGTCAIVKEGYPYESDCMHKIWTTRSSSAARGGKTYSQGQ